jgi:FlaA1/EpsC-like NDP-sugar epimerase
MLPARLIPVERLGSDRREPRIPGGKMDRSALGLLVIMVVLVATCIAIFFGFYNAMQRAGSETRRRHIARCALMNWTAMVVLAPALVLSALDVLPRWVCGAAIIAAFAIAVLAARYARRSTLRTQDARNWKSAG